MSRLVLALAASLALLAPSAVFAQSREPLHVDGSPHWGFMTTSAEAQFKAGAWMPIYVDVTAGPEGCPKCEMVVESADSDDVRNRYTVAVPQLDERQQFTIMGYTRPGSMASEITISFKLDGKNLIKPISDTPAGIEPWHHLYLCLGSRLNTLKAAVNPKAAEGEEEALWAKDTGNRRVAVIEDIRELPNRWFIYEPVDLMILSTGNRDNLSALLNEQEGRKDAIVDWVRRGGRLLVSVGRNQDVLAGIKAFQPMLPMAITGQRQMPELRGVQGWVGTQPKAFQNQPPRNNPGGRRPPIDVAKLEPKPGREIQVDRYEQENIPLVVRGSFGLGRVTMVAFDLDSPPFTTWDANGQKEFWKKLIDISAPPLPTDQGHMNNRMNFGMPGQEGNDLASQLVADHLEKFDDVPVISFGWVALFILLYILVVGPLDYFFLKKVVKRLELTWITFPTVVITISVIAYFTAYWLKGNDQKVNKIDVIDVDAHTGTVFGSTWFTIFSPRIQNYTIGVEPVSPGWAPSTGADQGLTQPTISWMGRPESGWGGSARGGGSQGLFRRAYDYLPEAHALLHVPIQVWSTKSFGATWQAPFDPTAQMVVSDLRYRNKTSPLSGTITSKLPVPLEDAWIYYPSDTKWYSLETLVPNTPKRVDALLGTTGTAMNSWLGTSPTQTTTKASGTVRTSASSTIRHLMFTQFADKTARNSTLRYLDQSWRIPHRNEVFIVGRLARQEGNAETLTSSPEMPTRLWLGDTPSPSVPRPPMTGTMTQETFVRIMLPVRSAEETANAR